MDNGFLLIGGGTALVGLLVVVLAKLEDFGVIGKLDSLQPA